MALRWELEEREVDQENVESFPVKELIGRQVFHIESYRPCFSFFLFASLRDQIVNMASRYLVFLFRCCKE